MNFAEFQTFRDRLPGEQPNVIDCAGTNLYRALAQLAPPPTAEPDRQVHRCHLASEWCERFGFSAADSRRALISCGVRDSLARLFRHCGETRAVVWLPSDNYPVYAELARAAGCSIRSFPTLPAPAWLETAPLDCGEILLITNPLKPLGRHLSGADVLALQAWLARSPRRRVWLDTVYTFHTAFDAGTLSLLSTGQVLLLHSLTKGWLQPRLFGITLVPEQDAAELTPLFRENPPPQLSLARARECMGIHAHTPAAVAAALHEAREALCRCSAAAAVLAAAISAPSTEAPGYFTAVRREWRELLERDRILGLPATVFGSDCSDITILSTLSFAR